MTNVKTIILFLAISSFSFSQEKKELKIDKTQTSPVSKSKEGISVTKENSSSKPQTISKRAGQPQRVHDNSYYKEEVKKIEANILAIDKKMASVNANPSEKIKATESGWFEDMDNIKRRLNAKKKIYLGKITK
tara:strand:- start:4106 stop:4504 length:399 start_codon:yes stop_codon:yes gene_type:complete